MLEFYSITDNGKNRSVNQDFLFATEKEIGPLPNLFIIADGMGGHNAGDFASKCAVEVVINEVQNSTVTVSEESDIVNIISNAIQKANEIVYKIASVKEGMVGMGTTMVVCTYYRDKLHIFNVGDSRLYVMKKELRQITEDHSYIEEMVRLYGVSREELGENEFKNRITRAVGAELLVEVDYFTVDTNEKMYVLMCTDGLTNMMTDKEIKEKLLSKQTIMQKSIDLIETANYNGGLDNISVILMRIL